MATIYEIADKYKLIQQLIEEGAPEEAFIEALNAIDGELAEKLENYAMIIVNRQANIDGKKAEAKRLLESAKSEENAIKRMKENMQFAMVTAGQTKVKGEKFNFTVQKNPPSLKVVDDAVIPPQFVSVEEVRNIDKKAILAELKNGAEINGVEIQQGESIRIR
ncbi:hypothetical protein SSIL_1397 [Solibacillus silvestris StLB046]|uniref:Siphovirus Gp157 family protein n=1 Tax=Solibacillus silvestris (strain StLB046) TaxID=1002809 RepID=F2F2I2_SOLSS|nr:siphovirus Gp157 family protein [Solibacillus silvestris]BAK15820.1 hypothetical protein SSIL_1397 [Solibacillus silvestris StLB046]